jgi:hypothetical protein
MKATDNRTSTIEEKLLEQYGGRGSNSLPQTLMFDHVSPATRLLEKRRQMFEVQEALNSQKEEFSRREDAFRRREDGLRRKDLELQESLIRFNKFLQENESKKNRALKRTAEEKKQREMKEIEISKLEDQLKKKIKEESMLKEEVEKNLKYQDYLENVVQTMTKFFPEISDILNRYKTLHKANFDLTEKHHIDEGENDGIQQQYINYKKKKENQILSDSNAIAEMQLKYEQQKTRTMRTQAELEEEITDASAKSLELGQIISSVSNILERCEESFRVRHNKPRIDRSLEKVQITSENERAEREKEFERTKSKLDEIAMYMVDYVDILRSNSTSSQGYQSGNTASAKTRQNASGLGASSVAEASKDNNSKSMEGFGLQ